MLCSKVVQCFSMCVVLLSIWFFVGCENKPDTKDILNYYAGHPIMFGHYQSSIDSMFRHVSKPRYAIVNYVDSIGCTRCKLHLEKWREINTELNNSSKTVILTVFILHPSIAFYSERLFEAEGYQPSYVIVDRQHVFYKENRLVPDQQFHTFLVDKDGNVVVVGNPVNNYRIKQLMKEAVKN